MMTFATIDASLEKQDLLVHVRVDVPRELNARQRELFEDLRRSLQAEKDDAPGDAGVFGRLFGKD